MKEIKLGDLVLIGENLYIVLSVQENWNVYGDTWNDLCVLNVKTFSMHFVGNYNVNEVIASIQ